MRRFGSGMPAPCEWRASGPSQPLASKAHAAPFSVGRTLVDRIAILSRQRQQRRLRPRPCAWPLHVSQMAVPVTPIASDRFDAPPPLKSATSPEFKVLRHAPLSAKLRLLTLIFVRAAQSRRWVWLRNAPGAARFAAIRCACDSSGRFCFGSADQVALDQSRLNGGFHLPLSWGYCYEDLPYEGIQMSQIWSRIALPALLFAIAACGQSPQSADLVPFSERPDETFVFQHKTEVVRGVVWLFEHDGAPVDYHGLVGLQEHSFTYVLEVKPKVFDLPDVRSVTNTEPSEVAELIEAANLFCEQTGYTRYTRRGSGAGIHSTSDSNLLVRHCLPPGAEIPTDYKVGDDIQRNPLLRALGVPPLRGNEFIRRYGYDRSVNKKDDLAQTNADLQTRRSAR